MKLVLAFAKAGIISDRRAGLIVQGAEDSKNYLLAREAFARYGEFKRYKDYQEYIFRRDLLPQRLRILFHDVARTLPQKKAA